MAIELSLHYWRTHGTPNHCPSAFWPIILFYFHNTDSAVFFYFRWSFLSTKGNVKLLYLPKRLEIKHKNIVKLLMPIPLFPVTTLPKALTPVLPAKDIMIKPWEPSSNDSKGVKSTNLKWYIPINFTSLQLQNNLGRRDEKGFGNCTLYHTTHYKFWYCSGYKWRHSSEHS